jgi:hypothetical protein
MITSRALVKYFVALLLLGWAAAGWLSPAAIAQSSTGSEPAKVVDTSPAGELAYWNQIKDSKNADDFSNYLDNFPNGMFVDPAKDRYEAISGHKYEPTAATDTSKAAPEEPSITVAPKQPSVAPAPRKTAKAKAKVNTRATASRKSTKKPTASASVRTKKKRVNEAVAQSRPVKKTVTRKKPVRKTVAQTKPAVHKKKSKVATNRKTCLQGIDCTGSQPDPFLPIMGPMGGRSGSGSGGGGAGGWH